MDISLSIVIPVYNEHVALNSNLTKIHRFLLKLDIDNKCKELILVNDGSTDNTFAILKKFQGDMSGDSVGIKIVSYEKNRGKGYAIKQGVQKAQGWYISFMDIDLSTPLSFFNTLYDEAKKGYPVVIGSRDTEGARVNVHQPFVRRFLGKSYYRLLRIFFSMNIKDTNCGFKMFSARKAKAVFDVMISERWAFDFEFLFLSRKYGFKIKEAPVEWAYDTESKVNLFCDSFYTLFELMKIKYREILGRYPRSLTLVDEGINVKDKVADGTN